MLPCWVEAITITEIAWMGTQAASDDEWIELYNEATTAVSLEGWSLVIGTSETSLSGVVPGNSYVVVHRSGQTTAPGTPLTTYTGALANTGSTVRLLRPNGDTADLVVAVDGWPAGDNQTKDTMQRYGTEWLTAKPTPGGATVATVSTPTGDASKDTAKIPTLIRFREEDVQKNSPAPASKGLAVQAPVIAYVGQPVDLEVVVSGVAMLEASLVHTWNLGDITTKKGEKITHTYTYPGQYVVTVKSVFKDIVLEARHEIDVRPVPLSISIESDNSIRIMNTAEYEVRLDGYQLRAGKTVGFPEGSIILPQQSVVVKASAVGKNSFNQVVLLDREGIVVEDQRARVSPSPSAPVSANKKIASVNTAASFGFVSDAESSIEPSLIARAMANESVTESEVVTNGKEEERLRNVVNTKESTSSVPYYALSLLLLVAVAGVFFKKH